MAQQIKGFGVLQTAKVLGILYALGGLLLAPFFLLAALFGGEGWLFSASTAVLIPVFYGAMGFIMTAVGAALYNVVAGKVGGIEVELTAALPSDPDDLQLHTVRV